jgi:hypothetical protein
VLNANSSIEDFARFVTRQLRQIRGIEDRYLQIMALRRDELAAWHVNWDAPMADWTCNVYTIDGQKIPVQVNSLEPVLELQRRVQEINGTPSWAQVTRILLLSPHCLVRCNIR